MGARVSAAVCAVAVFSAAGCAGASAEAAGRPAKDAPAEVVLDTYLRALVAGDCTAAGALTSSSFTVGNGELCGDVEVSDYALQAEASTPGPDQVVFSSVLTTGGSRDGTVPKGKVTWFYDLERQEGTWKVVSGGSGP